MDGTPAGGAALGAAFGAAAGFAVERGAAFFTGFLAAARFAGFFAALRFAGFFAVFEAFFVVLVFLPPFLPLGALFFAAIGHPPVRVDLIRRIWSRMFPVNRKRERIVDAHPIAKAWTAPTLTRSESVDRFGAVSRELERSSM